jgi:hypothetical protein
MKELGNVQNFLFLGIAYFGITFVVLVIRSVVDQKQLGWISRGGFLTFLWPRLRLWLVGLFSTIVLAGSVVNMDSICYALIKVSAQIGAFVIPVMVIGGFIGFSLVLCLFMPLFAAVQDNHEIS